MMPMLEQIEERYGEYPNEYLADGGFAKHEDIEEVQSCGTTVYVPVPEPRKPKESKEKGAETVPMASQSQEKKAPRDKHEPMPGDSKVIGEWRQRMGTEATKDIYKERASTIECVNAQARNRGLAHTAPVPMNRSMRRAASPLNPAASSLHLSGCRRTGSR